MRRIQYALAPGGFLFLGPSETLADLQSDFTAVSSKHKIYRILRHVSLPLDLTGTPLAPQSTAGTMHRLGRRGHQLASDAAVIDAGQSTLLRNYAPASLLLSSRFELLHVFGEVGDYLRIGEGNATLEVSKLLAAPLAPVAQALLHKGARGGAPLRSDVLTLPQPNGDARRLRLVVRPLTVIQGEMHLLLSFELEPELPVYGAALDPLGIETINLDRETAQRVETLERELNATRESLQATIEELETANEELQATNEEMMASNEELQSSNEELQSVNEELYTVNAENQEKIEILNRLNADLDSMAKAAAIATVFVDSNLRLTRFTPEATSLFKIRNSDLGRPIDDFANLLQYPNFIDELHLTVESGEMLQREIHAANGRIYLVRVLPYAVRPGDPRGAVATFIDITTLYDIERLQAVLDSLPEHVAVLDANGVISLVNRAWREFAIANGDPELRSTGVGANYLEVCNLDTACDGSGASAALDGIRSILDGRQSSFSMEYPCHSPTEKRWFAMHVAPIRHPGGGAIVSHINISQWSDAGNDP